jgi:hypothetical protein
MITVIAAPYDARQCPVCKVWVYVAAGPFSEGDRTKTVADWNHWEAFHLTPETSEMYPFFPFNDSVVQAVQE